MDNTDNTEPNIVPVNQDALSGKAAFNPDQQRDQNIDPQSEEMEYDQTSQASQDPSDGDREASVPMGNSADNTPQDEEVLESQETDDETSGAITPVDPNALADQAQSSDASSSAVSTTAEAAARDSKTSKKKKKVVAKKKTDIDDSEGEPLDDADANFQGQKPYAEFQAKLQEAVLAKDIEMPAPQTALPVNITLQSVDVDALSDIDIVDTTDNVDPEGLPYRAWWSDDDNEAQLQQNVVGFRDKTISSDEGSFEQEKIPLQSITPWFLTEPEQQNALDLINLNTFEV